MNATELRKALAYIDPNCDGREWVAVLRGIAAELGTGEEAEAVAAEWSGADDARLPSEFKEKWDAICSEDAKADAWDSAELYRIITISGGSAPTEDFGPAAGEAPKNEGEPQTVEGRLRAAVGAIIDRRNMLEKGDGKGRLNLIKDAKASIDAALESGNKGTNPVDAALEAETVEQGVKAILEATGQRRLQPASAFRNDPMPEAVIRRTDDYGDFGGTILAKGDVAILSGRGGDGKSSLSLQMMVAASIEEGACEVAGLSIAPGPTVLVSYEDVGRRVWGRISGTADALQVPAERLNMVHVVEQMGTPIFGVQDGVHWHTVPRRLPPWGLLWEMIAEAKPTLVVIDPVMAAMLTEGGGPSSVRLFMDALRSEAKAIGCGVLLIAHSTKGHRDNGKKNASGAVSGSAGWHDASRGVMALTKKWVLDHNSPESIETWELDAVKSNYGAPFKVYLQAERSHGGRGDILVFNEVHMTPDEFHKGSDQAPVKFPPTHRDEAENEGGGDAYQS